MAASGIVLVYFARLGGRLWPHQKILLQADAEAIARLKRYKFGGHHETGRNYSGSMFFVPDDTLLLEESSCLGIGPNDLYGGVVPYPFVKTKAITHAPVDGAADRPQGWSASFTERVRHIVLAGYTVFSTHDARIAGKRMLRRGSIRVKKPPGASGLGQSLVSSTTELQAVLERIAGDELATYGLVLEENLLDVRTMSVGHIVIDGLEIGYHGTQRCWNALDALPMVAEARAAVRAARLYDEAVVISRLHGFAPQLRRRTGSTLTAAHASECSSRRGALAGRAAPN
jgi:Protein of unknown function (DUF3182)